MEGRVVAVSVGAGFEIGPVLTPGERPWPIGWTHSITCMVCLHEQWESVLVPPYEARPIDEVVRCVACHAPRCGGVREADPCTRVLGHEEYHWKVSGAMEKPVPVG